MKKTTFKFSVALLACTALISPLWAQEPVKVPGVKNLGRNWTFLYDGSLTAMSVAGKGNTGTALRGEATGKLLHFAENGKFFGVAATLQKYMVPSEQDRTVDNNPLREAYLLFGSRDWGDVLIGKTISAADKLQVTTISAAPTTGLTGLNFPLLTGLNSPTATSALNPGEPLAPYASATGMTRENRLNYYSPKLGGFSYGFSYTPEYKASAETLSDLLGYEVQNDAEYDQIIEHSLRYDQKYGDLGISASLSHSIWQSRSDIPAHISNSLGLAASYKNFTFGGYMRRADNVSGIDALSQNAMGVSATYKWDRLTFGVGRARSKDIFNKDLYGTTVKKDESRSVTLTEATVSYDLRPGLDLFASVIKTERENNVGANAAADEATTYVIGATYSFGTREIPAAPPGSVRNYDTRLKPAFTIDYERMNVGETSFGDMSGNVIGTYVDDAQAVQSKTLQFNVTEQQQFALGYRFGNGEIRLDGRSWEGSGSGALEGSLSSTMAFPYDPNLNITGQLAPALETDYFLSALWGFTIPYTSPITGLNISQNLDFATGATTFDELKATADNILRNQDGTPVFGTVLDVAGAYIPIPDRASYVGYQNDGITATLDVDMDQREIAYVHHLGLTHAKAEVSLGYASMSYEEDYRATGNHILGTFNRTTSIQDKTEFSGRGFSIGAEADIPLGTSPLSVVVAGKGRFYQGEQSFTRRIDYSNSLGTTLAESFNGASDQSAAHLSGKLGVKYSFDWNSKIAGGIELGMTRDTYRGLRDTSSVNGYSGAFNGSQSGDFGLQSTYFKIGFEF